MKKSVVLTVASAALAFGTTAIVTAPAASARPVGPSTTIAAAAATDCDVATNAWAYCRTSAPLSEYRFEVKCYADGIANRFVWRYGPWRNQSGANVSAASCSGGDLFHSQYISFR